MNKAFDKSLVILSCYSDAFIVIFPVDCIESEGVLFICIAFKNRSSCRSGIANHRFQLRMIF